MHSPILKTTCWISGIIASLGAIHLGLMALGYNIFLQFNLDYLMIPFYYIVGLAGALCLVLLVLKLFCCGGCRACEFGEHRK